MNNTLQRYDVTLTPPGGEEGARLNVDPYDTFVWATDLPGAHQRVMEVMRGQDAVNSGFWSGWCYSIAAPQGEHLVNRGAW